MMTRLLVLNNVSTKAMLFGLAFALALGDFPLDLSTATDRTVHLPAHTHIQLTSLIGSSARSGAPSAEPALHIDTKSLHSRDDTLNAFTSRRLCLIPFRRHSASSQPCRFVHAASARRNDALLSNSITTPAIAPSPFISWFVHIPRLPIKGF